ncbi:Farnesyl pyrophosphate synthase [Orchesella cincta]|uniref:Farnesyl pyrophosphate synthase n=1 Tax=Orchesella cincta TaxID=48709 RepID=A0A1D2N3H7_ORCCI|nr:Farnesyl pyrophosphate synthase [Orchesella cincta]
MKRNCTRIVKIVGAYPNKHYCNAYGNPALVSGTSNSSNTTTNLRTFSTLIEVENKANGNTSSVLPNSFHKVSVETKRLFPGDSAIQSRWFSSRSSSTILFPSQQDETHGMPSNTQQLHSHSDSSCCSTSAIGKVNDTVAFVTSNSSNKGSSGSTASSSGSGACSPVGIPVASSSSSTFTSVRTVVTSQRLVEFGRDNMEQPKLMTKEEREDFMAVYHTMVKDLLEIPEMRDMEETNRWMARVLQYNVPHGKRNRGLATALAYKYLAPDELTDENVRLSYILGWCVEILQAFFLVSDDIMDGSETRRGRPCWYKVDNLGLAAVNDAILLEATIYQILKKHFKDKSYYAKAMEVMHDVTYKTIFGQSLDTRTGQDRRMETYTMDRYSAIVKYKTSFYSFYLPIALAMTMAEINDPNLLQQVRKVTLEMGHFFQIQDDFLDCFGDVEVTGKIGTDIQDCKCSWLFVVAMQRCSPEQKTLLLENYGQHDKEKISAVKKLYNELGLEDIYHSYEEQTYNLICTHIEQMNNELPKGLFYDMLHKIYKRSS